MPGRAGANGEGSIFAYRNGFAAYVWVEEPDGKRGRKWVYGKTREEVHDKWIKLHGQAKAGPVATRSHTLGEYAAYWLREIVKPNLAPGSYLTYEVAVRLYLVPGLGKKRLDKLRVSDVQTWINAVGRSCQCCAQGKDARRKPRRCCALGQCCQDFPSATSISHLRTVLRTILSQAITEGLISRNVASLVKLPPARARKRKAWSSDEARRFLESARADDDPLYAAYVLVLVLGLRKGEMLGLSWADVELDAGELTIDRQLQRVGDQLLHRETNAAAIPPASGVSRSETPGVPAPRCLPTWTCTLGWRCRFFGTLSLRSRWRSTRWCLRRPPATLSSDSARRSTDERPTAVLRCCTRRDCGPDDSG